MDPLLLGGIIAGACATWLGLSGRRRPSPPPVQPMIRMTRTTTTVIEHIELPAWQGQRLPIELPRWAPELENR